MFLVAKVLKIHGFRKRIKDICHIITIPHNDVGKPRRKFLSCAGALFGEDDPYVHQQEEFLRHAHHDYDVTAAVHVWNHPEEMEYVTLELIEDSLNLDDPDDVLKFLRKANRGVIEYVRYRFPYEDRVFTVKTEMTLSFFEQFYAIYEERG